MRPEKQESIPDDEREALLTIARGAVVTSGGFSGKRVLTSVVEIVLARGLGPAVYGVYAVAWRVAQLLVLFVTFGSIPALQRYVPAYRDEPRRQSIVAGLAYATTIAFGAVIGLGVWLSAPWMNELSVNEPSFPATMRAFGVLVGFLGVITVTAGVFRANESARGEVLLNKFLRPGVRLAGTVVALALGYSVVGVAGAIVVCTGVLAVSAVPLATRTTGITPTFSGLRTEARRFYNHAAPVAMSRLGKVFQSRIDVLLVGALLSAVAAGIYNVILVVVAVAWIPLQSFNQLLPPVASDLYASGRMDTLNAVYTAVTRLILTTVVPILAVILVYGPELLGLFGPSYTQGYVPLLVYLGGVFVGSTVGATGWLLILTDHQYARMVLDWLLAVLNLGLTYAFVVQFGLVGAALGTSLAISVQNGIQVLLLRRFEGLWPFDRTFLRPIGAGVSMLAVMWTIRLTVPGWLGVLLGGIAGPVVYVSVLWAIGPDPRDRLVVSELATGYRTGLTDWFGR